jgi:hypothetical protein
MASLSPGYSVAVDAGVGNGQVAVIPEPATMLLVLSALPVVLWSKRALRR